MVLIVSNKFSYGQSNQIDYWKKTDTAFEVNTSLYKNNKLIRSSKNTYHITDSTFTFNNTLIYYKADKYPKFIGGDTGLKEYLTESIKGVVKENIQFNIQVCLIVDLHGEIIYSGIFRSYNFHYDQKALSIISKMPQWEPAEVGKENVNSFYIISIDFTPS